MAGRKRKSAGTPLKDSTNGDTKDELNGNGLEESLQKNVNTGVDLDAVSDTEVPSVQEESKPKRGRPKKSVGPKESTQGEVLAILFLFK